MLCYKDHLQKYCVWSAQKMAANNNELNELAMEMAHADEAMHPAEAIYDTNYRLRENVNKLFEKLNLTAEEVQLFEQWSARLQKLPMNATRLEIFLQAGNTDVLNIVGI